MRLRQVALIARDTEPVAAAFDAVFGMKVGYRDPGVGVFGLTNVVMPCGGEFVEVVAPFRDDASGARYLARRGGDAGYMVILQEADALPHRARVAALGARVIAATPETSRYCYTHFHPADCSGVLLSIDSYAGDPDWQAPMSEWPPAGPDWRAHAAEAALGVAGVTIQSRDPLAACERWCALLDRGASTSGDALQINLDRGVIRFVPPMDDDGTGVIGLDIEVKGAHAVQVCGTVIRPVSV
jgi:hypothetical protein